MARPMTRALERCLTWTGGIDSRRGLRLGVKLDGALRRVTDSRKRRAISLLTSALDYEFRGQRYYREGNAMRGGDASREAERLARQADNALRS